MRDLDKIAAELREKGLHKSAEAVERVVVSKVETILRVAV